MKITQRNWRHNAAETHFGTAAAYQDTVDDFRAKNFPVSSWLICAIIYRRIRGYAILDETDSLDEFMQWARTWLGYTK